MSRQITPTPPPILHDHDSDSDNNQTFTDMTTSQSGRQDSAVPVPKTPNRESSRSLSATPHSRRATTPRSARRTPTPGRGSVRRNPSTPYTLRAMQQVLAVTPIRTVLRETRRYTPTDDLRLLSRLLVRERDDLRRRVQETIRQEVIETDEPQLLAPLLTVTRVTDTDFSRVSEYTTTITELDEEQRRVSERLSIRSNNLPSDLFNDLAVPEAVMDEFDNENFGFDSGFDQLARPEFSSDDDDDDLDNDLVHSGDEYDFSILRNLGELPPQFKPMSATSTTKRSHSTQDLAIPINLIRSRSRQILSELPTSKADFFFKQKQFPKHLLSHIQEISDEFLTQQMEDLSLYAKHANRKTITVDDFALLLKRYKTDDLSNVNNQTEIFCLAQQFCNMSELREIEANLYKNELAMSKRRLKKKRKIQVKDEIDDDNQLESLK